MENKAIQLTYEYLKDITNSDEILNLCGINERFDTEPVDVQNIRNSFLTSMFLLCKARDKAEEVKLEEISILQLQN